MYPLLRVFEGFAAHGWLLHPNATSPWATAFMSVIFYSLLKGSVLISPDRDVANPTSAQRPARDDGERIAFGRGANLKWVALEVGTTESSSHKRVPGAPAEKTA